MSIDSFVLARQRRDIAKLNESVVISADRLCLVCKAPLKEWNKSNLCLTCKDTSRKVLRELVE